MTGELFHSRRRACSNFEQATTVARCQKTRDEMMLTHCLTLFDSS